MAHPLLGRAVRAVDRFAELSGVAIAWLMVPLIAAVVYEVVARYALHWSSASRRRRLRPRATAIPTRRCMNARSSA